MTTTHEHQWRRTAGIVLDMNPPINPYACTVCGEETTGQDWGHGPVGPDGLPLTVAGRAAPETCSTCGEPIVGALFQGVRIEGIGADPDVAGPELLAVLNRGGARPFHVHPSLDDTPPSVPDGWSIAYGMTQAFVGKTPNGPQGVFHVRADTLRVGDLVRVRYAANGAELTVLRRTETD